MDYPSDLAHIIANIAAVLEAGDRAHPSSSLQHAKDYASRASAILAAAEQEAEK